MLPFNDERNGTSFNASSLSSCVNMCCAHPASSHPATTAHKQRIPWCYGSNACLAELSRSSCFYSSYCGGWLWDWTQCWIPGSSLYSSGKPAVWHLEILHQSAGLDTPLQAFGGHHLGAISISGRGSRHVCSFQCDCQQACLQCYLQVLSMDVLPLVDMLEHGFHQSQLLLTHVACAWTDANAKSQRRLLAHLLPGMAEKQARPGSNMVHSFAQVPALGCSRGNHHCTVGH
ncbi:hypothetical protein ABBQ32_007643 [Trebouxia sp. C0010 RCD-2024]